MQESLTIATNEEGRISSLALNMRNLYSSLEGGTFSELADQTQQVRSSVNVSERRRDHSGVLHTRRSDHSNERSTRIHKAQTQLGDLLDEFEIEMDGVEYEVRLNKRKNDNIRPVNVTVTNKNNKADTDYVASGDLGLSQSTVNAVREYIRHHLLINLRVNSAGDTVIEYISLAASNDVKRSITHATLTDSPKNMTGSISITSPKESGRVAKNNYSHGHRRLVPAPGLPKPTKSYTAAVALNAMTTTTTKKVITTNKQTTVSALATEQQDYAQMLQMKVIDGMQFSIDMSKATPEHVDRVGLYFAKVQEKAGDGKFMFTAKTLRMLANFIANTRTPSAPFSDETLNELSDSTQGQYASMRTPNGSYAGNEDLWNAILCALFYTEDKEPQLLFSLSSFARQRRIKTAVKVKFDKEYRNKM